jgi:hypothetical protein
MVGSLRRVTDQRPGFSEVSDRYEAWRGRRIALVDADVQAKYLRMAESPWLLARGGYHRFGTQFAERLPELAKAPVVVSAGDLHAEKFGTWRDRAGRLVWGIHGLEEADLLPYTADLVRLASTVLLAIDAGLLDIGGSEATAAILQGWSERIAARRHEPFVIGIEHADLFHAHRAYLRDPVRFEAEIDALEPFERALPKPAARMLAAVTPAGDFRPQLKRGRTGLPSLGARRIIAAGSLDGGLLVREVLQVPGPVSMWSDPKRMQVAGLPAAIDAARGVAAEPWRRQSRKWVVRGLDGAFTSLAWPNADADVTGLLAKMGAEAANIHLTDVPEAAGRKAIRRDAAERPEGWLEAGASVIADAARCDHADWAAVVAEGGATVLAAAGGESEL